MSRSRNAGFEPRAPALPPGGVYVLALRLSAPRTIRAGSLGQVSLDAGQYLYAGSAQRGLRPRLARHFRPHKPCRWHIDYVTSRVPPRMAGVWALTQNWECRLAEALLARWPAAAQGFGSSDCGCRSHLIGPVSDDWLAGLTAVTGVPAVLVGPDEC